MSKLIDFTHYKKHKTISYVPELEKLDVVTYSQCKMCTGDIFVLIEINNKTVASCFACNDIYLKTPVTEVE